MKTVLITGGAGFIGSTLAEKLLDQDHSVIVVDNFDKFYDSKVKRKNLGSMTARANFSLYEVDIRNLIDLRTVFALHKVDTVVHMAAKAGVRPSLHDPQAYIATNVLGTANILECAKNFAIGKIVFASSSSVYGESDSPSFSESLHLFKPVSPYAATKLAGEQLCFTYSRLYGISIVCLRFFTVYGPRQRPDLAINKFVSLIEKQKPIPMYGDGTAVRDYTYVDDIVSGITAAMEYATTPYEIINLGGGEPILLADMIREIEKALGMEAVVRRLPAQPGDVPRTAAEISKARELLQYRPRTTFREGIMKYISWRKMQENALIAELSHQETYLP